MKIGQLSDFSEKELNHPTFAIFDESFDAGMVFVLGSLTVPNECSTTVQVIEHYVNGPAVKPVLVSAMRQKWPQLSDPTFEYVPRNDRNL